MDSQIIYFVSYSCPRCKAELEAQHGAWEGWLRCPSCGHPSLPPELLFGHPTTRRGVQGHDEDVELVVMEEAPEESGKSDRPPIIASRPSNAVSASRLICIAGLVISLFLLLVFYLDQQHQFTGIFGALAIVFFLLLLRTPRRNGRGED